MIKEKYHKYVFNTENREFVGAFDDMYKAEAQEGFDSWHQDDLSKLWVDVAQSILGSRFFENVLDIGCGKGMFTQRLKREGNSVLGVDISETAVQVAQQRFHDIQFLVEDIQNEGCQCFNRTYDLINCINVLSYVSNWRELLKVVASRSRYFFMALYVPENPIGFVKSFDELKSAIKQNFDVIEEVDLVTQQTLVIFSKSRIII